MSIEKPVNRRGVLEGMAGVGVGLWALGWAAKYGLEGGDRPTLEAYPGRRIELSYGAKLAEEFEEPTRYAMRGLAGKFASGLTEKYLNHRGRIPAELSLSFPQHLHELWMQKIKLNTETTEETERLGEALLIEYQTLRDNHLAGQMPFEHFAGKLSETSAEIAYALENKKGGGREKLAELYALSPHDVQMLLHLTARADGRVLSAYSMTEVMPDLDLYDFILKNAGVEFLLRVPSLYDKLTSFGMFQFTSLAHRKGVGSAKANLALPLGAQIPDSMERLVTLRDHVGAALLFAINNLAITINALRAHGAKDSTIQLISDMDRRDFTELIAAFHNRPTDAAKGVTAWVKAGGSAPFHTFCPETVKTYAERSGTHYDKVQERLQRAY